MVVAPRPPTDPITGLPLTDQRGALRVVGAAVDIGAVELQVAATTTSLSASPIPAANGQPVTLKATVTPASAAPNNPVTGTVTFLSGTTVLGTATLDANGEATFTTALSAGTHSLTATYPGNSTPLGELQVLAASAAVLHVEVQA